MDKETLLLWRALEAEKAISEALKERDEAKALLSGILQSLRLIVRRLEPIPPPESQRPENS